MTNLLESFITTTQYDFTWPYPVPIVMKPAQPPMNTGIRRYTPKINPEDYNCNAHYHKTNKSRYEHLAEKEQEISNELVKDNRERKNLAGSNCESMNETMRSVYETDYAKGGLPISGYRSVMAAGDSSHCSPIKPEGTELQNGYRDPMKFRYSAIERPHIQPAEPINLHQVPEGLSLWGQPFTGRSEYMDTISKMGLINMKNRQYLEPLTSFRKRFSECKL